MQRPLLFALCTCLLIASSTAAEDEKKEGDKPDEVTLAGVFEAVQATELAAETEELTSLKIRKIVPHGATVLQGQTLVAFESEDIDKQIRDAARALQLGELDLEAAEFNFEQFQKFQELDRTAAERAWKAARQSHDNYVRVDRDRSVLSAEFSLKSSQASFDNAAEELKQLEQMYKEDELTEESEEIVLKRAKQAVESAQFRLDNAKIQYERSLEQSIPRTAKQQDDTLARAEIAFRKAIQELSVAKAKQTLDMQQKREKFHEQTEKLQAMQAERRSLVITAPHDGIAFHGKLTRGRLSDKPSTLEAGSAATNKQTLITLANPRRLQIRTELTEALLKQVNAGMTGKATPNALGEVSLNVRVKKAARIPHANNKFDCVFAIRKGQTEDIVPGTTCEVKLTKKE